MRIGIDARPLQAETQFRGIGKAFENLLIEIAKQTKTENLVFYVDKGLPIPKIIQLFPRATIKSVRTSRLGRTKYIRSFMASFTPLKPRSGEVDVILQYDAFLGVPTNIPTVTVFHDLIPYLFREQEVLMKVRGLRRLKNSLAREMYWTKYLKGLANYKRSARIIAISESSKKDLLGFSPDIPGENIDVIYHGISETFNETTLKPSPPIKNITNQPYLLYVGGIDIRKNIVGLLKAFYELKPLHTDLKLIMIGKEFELKKQLGDLGWFTVLDTNPEFANDVILPGFVSDADLAYIYRHAEAFVFPSRYEGFGLPPLEAMKAGCPVITYDNSSLPEVVEDAAIVVKDGEPLASAIEKVLGNKKLRTELIKKGKKQVAKFTWKKTAKATLAALKQVAR